MDDCIEILKKRPGLWLGGSAQAGRGIADGQAQAGAARVLRNGEKRPVQKEIGIVLPRRQLAPHWFSWCPAAGTSYINHCNVVLALVFFEDICYLN